MAKPPKLIVTKTTLGVLNRDDDPAYWTALGKFVDRFAMMESALYLYLASYIGLDWPTAAIFFGRSRIDELTQRIRSLWKSRKLADPLHAELTEALDHLGDINRTRNDLMHYGSFMMIPEMSRMTSKVMRGSQPFNEELHLVSADVLALMVGDVERVQAHFSSVTPCTQNAHLLLEERAKRYPVLVQPWLYKRAQYLKPLFPTPDPPE